MISERTLVDAMSRADGLRGLDFKEDYSHQTDQDDLVVLANEVHRLQIEVARLQQLMKG